MEGMLFNCRAHLFLDLMSITLYLTGTAGFYASTDGVTQAANRGKFLFADGWVKLGLFASVLDVISGTNWSIVITACMISVSACHWTIFRRYSRTAVSLMLKGGFRRGVCLYFSAITSTNGIRSGVALFEHHAADQMNVEWPMLNARHASRNSIVKMLWMQSNVFLNSGISVAQFGFAADARVAGLQLDAIW